MLNSKMSNFATSLANLDRLPSRYTDSVFMFYVKDGVTKVDDVLATQVSVINSHDTYILCTPGAVLVLLEK